MGIRTTASDPCVALYDSVTGYAFGPVFENDDMAEHFLLWLRSCGPEEIDPRRVPVDVLRDLHSRWFAESVDAEGGVLREHAYDELANAG